MEKRNFNNRKGANKVSENKKSNDVAVNPLGDAVVDQPKAEISEPEVKSDETAEKAIAEAQTRLTLAETAFANAKTELSEAKLAYAKLTGKKGSKEKSGPGVIATILTLVSKAPKTGITKAEILAKLTEMFPERATDGMEKTINVQLPKRMSKERGINIVKLESGAFLVKK